MVHIFYTEWVAVTGEDSNIVVMLIDLLLVCTVQGHMCSSILPCRCKIDHQEKIFSSDYSFFSLPPFFSPKNSILTFYRNACKILSYFVCFFPWMLSMGLLNLSTSIFSHFLKQFLCWKNWGLPHNYIDCLKPLSQYSYHDHWAFQKCEILNTETKEWAFFVGSK